METKQTQNEVVGSYGKVFFQWEVDEYPEPVRSRRWYLIMGILAFLLIVYSIWTQNFLFALIIILAVYVVFLKSYYLPRKLDFQITEDGIIMGQNFFPYRQFKNFYIIYDPPAIKKLYFDMKNVLPSFSIPLGDKNPLLVREILLKYMDEDLEKEQLGFDDQMEILLKL